MGQNCLVNSAAILRESSIGISEDRSLLLKVSLIRPTFGAGNLSPVYDKFEISSFQE